MSGGNKGDGVDEGGVFFHVPAASRTPRVKIRPRPSRYAIFRLSYESKVIYQSKDGTKEKIFDLLEWLVAMYSHIPNKGEQVVRNYDYCSNASRGNGKNKIWMSLFLQYLKMKANQRHSGEAGHA